MADDAKRAELIALVEQILRAEGTGKEQRQLLNLLKAEVVCPYVSDLIYWPHRYGLGANPSAKEIADAALAYRPILLGPPAEPGERDADRASP
ncbi:MAG TPA: hypothetical protein VD886_04345 [Herpetosiphonaceae bacterium]|nr:hypothetical protein [Herpetosiphonaceae bacterium]